MMTHNVPGTLEFLLVGPPKSTIVNGLTKFTLHRLADAPDRAALIKDVGPRIRAIASSVTSERIGRDLMAQLPRLEIVATFGVGYDHIDVAWAAEHGVTVTNTPQVLTEEVADTALGLLLCTVREFPQAERYLRAGKWVQRAYHLTRATLRDRTVGMVGMGAIGQAIARRAGSRGHPHQHGARLGGGRAGVDQGAQGQDHHVRGPRRLRQRAGGAGRVDHDGQRRSLSPRRLGLGPHSRPDGPARGRQSRRLGGRQACAHAGLRDALAAAAADVNRL